MFDRSLGAGSLPRDTNSICVIALGNNEYMTPELSSPGFKRKSIVSHEAGRGDVEATRTLVLTMRPHILREDKPSANSRSARKECLG